MISDHTAMPTEGWTWGTVMADSTTITFIYGGTTVTLPSPEVGAQHEQHVPSDGLQTGNGWFGYRFGAVWYGQSLRFRNVSHSQLDALLNFYADTVDGMASAFTYTDSKGETHTARFLEAPRWETKHRASPGQYDVEVRIRTSTKVT